MSKRARSSSAAISRYKEPLQRALSCVSNTDIWITAAPAYGDEHHRLTVASGPMLLSCEAQTLFLDASQRFSVYNDGTEFRIRTEGYIYTLDASQTLDREVVSWHWHPPTRSRPHVHIGGWPLRHIPTGRVTFEAIARYVIEELGATPRREDWADTLLASEALHAKYRSWSVAPNVDPV